jgi:hypothetical protein
MVLQPRSSRRLARFFQSSSFPVSPSTVSGPMAEAGGEADGSNGPGEDPLARVPRRGNPGSMEALIQGEQELEKGG